MTPQAPRIDASLAEKVNLANFQNSIPCLRELRLTNETEQEWGGLELSIQTEPAFLKTRSWRIDGLRAHGVCTIEDLDLKLDGPLFASLAEAEKATAVFSLRTVGEEGQELARLEKVVELLPRNQWGGLSQLPDLLASFVQPNESAVDRILKSAAQTLRQNGKNGAIDGYQGGASRVWEIASAIWTAVAGLELDYALPPASFETEGQKIRTPGQILESRLGTCLDLSLLFTAVLEQAGLNPLIVCTKGHAFVGVWLKEEDFSTTTVDDITALRKRLKLKELLVFETTLTTGRPVPNFSYAVERGEGRLAPDKDDEFELAVDVKRARRHRIKPLSNHDITIAPVPTESVQSGGHRFEDAPDLPEFEIQSATDAANLAPKDRLSRWQRKLLDLSLRNSLLNFRAGKMALKLDAPDPGALEDLLADAQPIKILPRPALLTGSDARDKTLFEGRERIELLKEHALGALKRNEVYIDLEKEELESRLLEMYRNARTNLQEGGANTLYLALGFLVWTKGGTDTVKHRAPLILIPVTLDRKSVRSGFSMSIHEDEPRFNPTLLEMLRQDFKLGLPVAEGELPKDDSGLDIAGIWKSIGANIKDIKGWEVSEDVFLSTFSFSKYLMWKDLTERTEQLCQNPVVKHLLETPREHFPSGISFPSPTALDREFSPKDVFCPLPADSSQLTAIMAAVKGKDFVLIGPPGTGKSQTITNIIAQCLAEGKRVLFVAEKIAALEVVYRRLRDVKLAEFCLEIHSNKAKKLEIISHLHKSWESKGVLDPLAWAMEADRLAKLRGELNLYVERLHLERSNGLSIHQAIGKCVAGIDLPRIEFSWPNADTHSKSDLERMRELVHRLEVNALALGLGQQAGAHPLQAVGQGNWSLRFQTDFAEALEAARAAVANAQAGFNRLLDSMGLSLIPSIRKHREVFLAFAQLAAKAEGKNWRYLLRADRKALLGSLGSGADLLRRHRAIQEALPAGWSAESIRMALEGLALLERRKLLVQGLRPWHPESQAIVERGVQLMEQTSTTVKALSVAYGGGAEQLNPYQMLANWKTASTQIWPLSWIGKRQIRKMLESAVEGAGVPDPSRDLPGLVAIRDLAKEITKLDPGPSAADVWQGVKTREEAVKCALAFQGALRAALADQPWEDSGFGAIERGLCGEAMALQLSQLRELREIDTRIKALEPLRTLTTGAWAGKQTVVDSLRIVLDFEQDRLRIAERGSLQREHVQVSQGLHGAAFANEFQALSQRSVIETEISALAFLEHSTSGMWKGLDTAWQDLENGCAIGAAVERILECLAAESDRVAFTTFLGRLVEVSPISLSGLKSVLSENESFVEVMKPLQSIERLAVVGMFSSVHSTQVQDASLPGIEKFILGMIENLSGLRSWCAWKSCWNDAKEIGLGALPTEIMTARVRLDDLKKVFEANYSRWWLHSVVDTEEVIRKFVSAEHERRIKDFCELDARFTQLTSSLVRARLCANIPSAEDAGRNSEWGILRREINKKKRHMPLREMMKAIPNVMAKLSPCLLMSPLSIAQYLTADAENFDVVVFDEASQIPVWDAIGAMARGRQVVMVGDPKQLPPTNFFDRAEADYDDEDVEADMESILDECMGANLPTLNINWHYRSRSESLIAFSNHRYYGGDLVTFPSPVNPDKAVSFHLVQGVYEKGGARTNKPEAKALVADLVALLKSKAFRNSGKTIGVVTFNSEQQRLIENLLDDERRRDPSIEPYFDDVELEPVFVKNIESVQGDERDIMYFSITYGPDLTGAVSMNFGPMNRNGGERRLNVAITRARHELKIFSTLKPEQMDLTRTQAIGVRDLKHFLEYAQRGSQAIAESSTPTGRDFDSPFEASVAQALGLKGWTIHTQVGISSFRIDLAVVHPDAPGIYLAGVECDGATYHSSATARDRDKLREQVLRGLGWEILRIWSTDWWIDRNGTLEAMHNRLNNLLAQSRDKRNAAALEAHASESAQEDAKPEERPSEGDGYLHEADLTDLMPSVDPEAFYAPSYEPFLVSMIAKILQAEAPIRDETLIRKVARAHGFQRSGNRIVEKVTSIVLQEHAATTEQIGSFFWKNKSDIALHVPFRKPTENASRSIPEIAIQELTSLARATLAQGKQGEAAVAAMSRVIGSPKLNSTHRERLEQALQMAESGLAQTL
ncbi:MAG: DUF3320 domain-containing protein [Fibrobacterota bacterium]|nr:MAG: DUF3320 domain-containing protein [Fibrobacterota bacterium]